MAYIKQLPSLFVDGTLGDVFVNPSQRILWTIHVVKVTVVLVINEMLHHRLDLRSSLLTLGNVQARLDIALAYPQPSTAGDTS